MELAKLILKLVYLLILIALCYSLLRSNIQTTKLNLMIICLLISVLLVSKVPTLALKKISISPKATVFLLLGVGIIFIALLFYTLETLLIFGIIYLISIPISTIIYRNQNRKNVQKISDDSDEDIL